MLLGKVRRAYKQRILLKSVLGSMRLLGQKVKFRTLRRFDFQAIPDSKSFLTWHKRPRLTAGNLSPSSRLDHSDTAIVLQGPVRGEIKFVAETVKLYRRLHPGVHIIVSTWEGTPKENLLLLSELGAEIILSEPPKYPGVSNTNLQLVSSKAGLAAAQERGVVYSLKTRVDQRLYSPAALSIMKNLAGIPVLPAQASAAVGRLVALSSNTFMRRIYGLSDFLTFGRTEDVLAYWSPPLTNPDQFDTEPNIFALGAVSEESRGYPEVYLCSSFLQRHHWNLKWSHDDWVHALVERFVIADASSLDFFWNKYSSREYLWRRYGELPALEEIAWGDWIELSNDRAKEVNPNSH